MNDSSQPTPGVAPGPVHARVGAEAFVVGAFDMHHAELFTFLARVTRDRSAAEELLEAAFRRLADEARAGRAPAQVRGWLYRAAAGLVVERSRQRPGSGDRGSDARRREDGHATPLSAEAGAPSRDRAAEMERVFEGLSAQARLALLLSAEGFTGDEIAGAMARSGEATRALLSRARTRVRIRRELFGGEAR